MIERLARAVPRDDAWLDDPAATVPPEDRDEVTWPAGSGTPSEDPLARQLSTTSPGPDLASLLGSLDYERISQAALLEAITATERLARWATAKQYEVFSEAQRRCLLGEVSLLELSSEVSTRLSISPRAAEQRSDEAFEVHQLYPEVWRAMERGDIDRGKARIIATETAFVDKHLPVEQVDALVAKLALRAAGLTHGKLRALARKAVAAAVPAQVKEERHEAARAQRRIVLTPMDDGMAELYAFLPAPDAVAAMTVIDRLAAKCDADDDRVIDQRRADAFAGLFRSVLDAGATPDGPLPTAQRYRPHLFITVTPAAGATASAEGAPDVPSMTTDGDACAPGTVGAASIGGKVSAEPVVSLVGYGEITPTMALRSLDQAALSLVVRNPQTGEYHHTEPAPTGLTAGQVLRGCTLPGSETSAPPVGRGSVPARAGPAPPEPDPSQTLTERTDPTGGKVELKAQRIVDEWQLSSPSYRPSVALVRSILLRDETCTFPTCRVPAWRTDVDHIEPYDPDRPAEEQTTEDNLHAVCRGHHRLKTLFGWSVRRDPTTGITTWVSPSGNTLTRRAEYLDEVG